MDRLTTESPAFTTLSSVRRADLALEIIPQGGLGDLLQADCRGIAGLVGVEVEVEAVLDGEREHEVEQFLKIRHHVGEGPEYALRCRDALGQRREPFSIARGFYAGEA